MRNRSNGKREVGLLAALLVLACLWLGGGGCSNDDINFPGNVPPRTATGAPTATPTADDS